MHPDDGGHVVELKRFEVAFRGLLVP